MRKYKGHSSGVKIVAERDAQIRLFESILVGRNARGERNVFEFPFAIAPVQIIRLAVVGDEKIELAIVVKIGPDCRKAIEMFWIVTSGFFRYIGEGSVSVVVIEIVGRTFQPTRTALHINSQILTRFCRTEDRQVIQAKINIVGDKQIGPAIAVVISEGGSGRPS